MVDVVKGQKIWVELEATEDMTVETQQNMWELYSGKLKIDKFETTSIIWSKDYFSDDVKKELTNKLLELKLLDTNMLNNIAYNGGGLE